jgi:hypothetical protein
MLLSKLIDQTLDDLGKVKTLRSAMTESVWQNAASTYPLAAIDSAAQTEA